MDPNRVFPVRMFESMRGLYWILAKWGFLWSFSVDSDDIEMQQQQGLQSEDSLLDESSPVVVEQGGGRQLCRLGQRQKLSSSSSSSSLYARNPLSMAYKKSATVLISVQHLWL